MRSISIAAVCLVAAWAPVWAQPAPPAKPGAVQPPSGGPPPMAGAGHGSPTAPPGSSGYQGGANGIPTDCPPGSPRPECQQATIPEPHGQPPRNPTEARPGASGGADAMTGPSAGSGSPEGETGNSPGQ